MAGQWARAVQAPHQKAREGESKAPCAPTRAQQQPFCQHLRRCLQELAVLVSTWQHSSTASSAQPSRSGFTGWRGEWFIAKSQAEGRGEAVGGWWRLWGGGRLLLQERIGCSGVLLQTSRKMKARLWCCLYKKPVRCSWSGKSSSKIFLLEMCRNIQQYGYGLVRLALEICACSSREDTCKLVCPPYRVASSSCSWLTLVFLASSLPAWTSSLCTLL